MSPLVLVTGATGAVGPAVVGHLQKAGWRVRALVRGECDLPDVEIARGDLRNAESLHRAAAGVDAIVHMAGLLHLFHAGAEHDAEFHALNVEATRVLLDASPAKRFVFFSSISVYGSGGPFDERSPLHPENAYARTKAEAEKLVLAAGGTVLRLAAVYGPRMKGNYAALVRAIRFHRFLPIGRGRNHRTLVYDQDVARAVVTVLASERARGEVYNVTDGTTHPLEEIISAICEGLGRRPPRMRVPAKLVRAVGVLVPRVRRLLVKYLEDVRVDGSKLQRELAFQPSADFRGTWRESVRELR